MSRQFHLHLEFVTWYHERSMWNLENPESELLQANIPSYLCPSYPAGDCAYQVVPAPDFPPEVKQQWDRCQWILYRLRRAHLDGPPAQPAQALAAAGDPCSLLLQPSVMLNKKGLLHAHHWQRGCFWTPQPPVNLNRKVMLRDHDKR